MSFAPEPAFAHGDRGEDRGPALQPRHARRADAQRRCGATSPSSSAIRASSRSRASLWWPILHGIVLRMRPAKSARKYAQHLDARGLAAQGLDRRSRRCCSPATSASAASRCSVRHAMRYGQPSIASVLDALTAAGAERVLVLPLYPQYAAATTASVGDAVAAWMQRRAQPARAALRQALPRRPGLHRRAGAPRRATTG